MVCACWFACHSWLATSVSGRFFLQMSCIVLSFSCVAFALFRFRLFAFIKAAALRSIVLRYVCAPAGTRSLSMSSFVLSSFCFVGGVAFSEYFVPLPFPLSMKSTLCVFRPDGVFLPCDHGLGFDVNIYVIIQSNKAKNRRLALSESSRFLLVRGEKYMCAGVQQWDYAFCWRALARVPVKRKYKRHFGRPCTLGHHS